MTGDRAPSRVHTALMQAAFGAAALYRPGGRSSDLIVALDEVVFLLDGHLEAWSRWGCLDDVDARRLGRLLRRRPQELASAGVVTQIVRRLLLTDGIPGCSPVDGEPDRVRLSPGMPLADFVDSALDELDAVHALRPRFRPAATAGVHTAVASLRGDHLHPSRSAETHVVVPEHDPTNVPEPPRVVTAGPAPRLQPTHHELLTIAARIDAELPGEPYRERRLRMLLSTLTTPTGTTDRVDLVAGPTRVLNAPTGSGKNILIEAMACWAVSRGHPMTIVLSRNVEVLKCVNTLDSVLPLFTDGAVVTPLMSPRALSRTIEEVLRTKPSWDPDGTWTHGKLGYGCAIVAGTSSDVDVDDWRPGSEPCSDLRPRSSTARRARPVACPWRTSCGKFRLARSAAIADVIVTTHGNLQTGRLQAPLHDGVAVTDKMSVEELVMLRSHLVVIDEVDAFQSSALNQAARGVMLAQSSGAESPVVALDNDFRLATGRVDPDVDESVRRDLARCRYLAENYVAHLVYDRLGPTRRSVIPGTPARSWHVARRWDAWLAAKLAGITDDEDLTTAAVHRLRSLFPDEVDPDPTEPPVYGPIRDVLRAVAEIPGRDAVPIGDHRIELDHLLVSLVPDQVDRDRMIDRLLRRAQLEQLRRFLTSMVVHAPQLAAAGIEAAHTITEALGPYARWRVTPNGPMGRLVFAFSEYGDSTTQDGVWLRAVGFGDDPHVGALTLGDTTALCHAGTRRIVLGLSATAYFPLAPRHHLHTRPTWWMPDRSSDVTVRAVEVPAPVGTAAAGRGHLVRVSGRLGRARTDALQQIARGVAPRVLAELQRLAAEAPDRARVLLATTSYDSCDVIANGLLEAGLDPSRLVVLARPDPDRTDEDQPTTGRQPIRRPRRLAADRVEEFAALPGADVLIAPLARVQRGVNIIGTGDQSALGSIWLMVRPVPVLEEPEELVAHVNAKALRDNPGSEDPLGVLARRRSTAGRHFEDIVTSAPFLRGMPDEVQIAVAAQILNGALQLLGRARRGGTPATLHLVDGAFHDTSTGTDFARLIRALRARWTRTGEIQLMLDLYGTTLQAFFDFADQRVRREN